MFRHFEHLAGHPSLRHGVTTRRGGVSEGAHARLNLGLGSGDHEAAVRENRRRVVEALALDGFVVPRQVHAATVRRVDHPEDDPGDADALVTNVAGIGIAVIGADCPLVLLVDPAHGALGVVHSGWRGTAAGVVPAAIASMGRHFDTAARDLLVGLAPSISATHYEVGPEVEEAFLAADRDSRHAFARDAGGRLTLDVAQVILLQLEQFGVPPDHVERMTGCTYAEPALWFSHRRDGPATGRHALVAGWRT